MTSNSTIIGCGFAVVLAGSLGAAEWPEYLGGPGRSCYSPLTEINVGNVRQLQVAWEFHSADPGQTECNPIVVDGYINVPNTPGLGFTDLNVEACSPFLHPDDPGVWEPTDHWANERSHDRLWS